MGGGFAGAFATGLANSMQKMQEQRTQEEYKKALIDQSKLQTKMLENKLNLAQQEQGMMAAYLKTKGIELPTPPPVQLAQTQPEQKQGLLGRLFNPQPQAPVQQVAAQTPLPQMIAQGQAQGQMPPGMTPGQAQPNQAFMEDLMGHKLFGLTPWKEKFEAEKQNVGTKVTVMTPQGPATLILNKSGQPMNMYSQPPEYGQVPVEGGQGEKYIYSYPKTK